MKLIGENLNIMSTKYGKALKERDAKTLQTLAVEEACESLKVVLAGFLKPRRKVAELLSQISIHPTHFRLAYLPFLEDQHDFLQPQTQIAVNKNLLTLSSNL